MAVPESLLLLAVSPLKCSWPFSYSRPNRDEQPGPPCSHSTSGSVAGEPSDSVSQ